MTVPKAPAFSTAEYRRRLAAVRHGLAARGLDGLVLFSPGHINYLTGWTARIFSTSRAAS